MMAADMAPHSRPTPRVPGQEMASPREMGGGRLASAPQESGVSDLVRQTLDALTESERKIARVLLSGPPSACLGPASQLATAAGVSGPTVSRFVARLGFTDYNQFQQVFRAELDQRLLSPVTALQARGQEHTRESVTGQMAAHLSASIEQTLARLPSADLNRVIALFAGPRPLVITGGSVSHTIATYLSHALRQFRDGVHLVSRAPDDRAAVIANASRRDVVACFDFRRYERATAVFAQEMKARGATLVVFTDPWLSPIAAAADIVVSATVASPSPFETLTPTLAVVETLVVGTFETLGERGISRLTDFNMVADRWLSPWSRDTSSETHHAAEEEVQG